MLEREVKLLFANATEARAAVLAAGASPLRSRRLQDDALFDTPDQSLRRQGCALRLRADLGRCLITFKGPVQLGPMKEREELETIVSDGDVLANVLEALGLRVSFRYQKYREEFAAGEVVIAIDETPIGVFVEIEGGEQGILETTRALGRSPADFILDTYRGLYAARCAQLGAAAGHDMLFASE